MKIYLVRHGETDKNKEKLLQGQSDSELNDYGRLLAHKTKEGLKDVKFDVIFTSPLKRAKETAAIIKDTRNIPFYEEKRIQEISFGDYEGFCFDKDNYTIPDKGFMNFFNKPEDYRTPPNGESLADVIKRTGEFLQELVKNPAYADKTILISTHGCALKAMLSHVKKEPIEQFWGSGVHKNCAVSILNVKDGNIDILEEGKIYYE